jgi:formylglycine-generating enzyme required for sulfatase activity
MATSPRPPTPDPVEKPSERPAAPDTSAPTLPIRGGPAADGEPTRPDFELGFLSPCEDPKALGRLGTYKILQVHGRGAFGIVFKALDEKLHRVVAVKVLPPQLAASLLARKRFLREAQAAAAIHHEHVVGIYAVEEERCPYLVMEFIHGPSLQDRIEESGPLPLDEILRIGHQTACGLAAAHQQGLIHRDIKPSNILLENGDARVKITDFGLARAVDDASLSQSGVIYGTPAYMAPEQAAETKVDHRSDLFSLGSVLYTLATGQMPFGSYNTLAVLRRVMEESPPPLRDTRPDLPQWFADLVARLHAKKPEQRFQTAQEVADLLARHLAAVRAQGSAYNPMPRPRRLRRWLVAALAGAVVLGAAGAWSAGFFRGPATAQPGEQGTDPGPRAAPQPTPTAGKPTRETPPLAVGPFDAAQARQHQAAWAKHLQLPLEQVNKVGMTLRLVPPGEFVTDAPEAHTVRLSKPFFVGAHEVTFAQFRLFVEETGYKTDAETDPLGGQVWSPQLRKKVQRPDINWRSPGFPQTDQHPVCCVTWNDATAFCRWLSTHEGKSYRLPTEAEWEFACRAGTTTAFHYGAAGDPKKMNVGVVSTTPVGSFAPNAFGLWDMHGNVYEWCLDGKRKYETGLVVDPRGPLDGPERVIRGGGYSTGPNPPAFSGGRSTSKVEQAYSAIGLRVVLECP